MANNFHLNTNEYLQQCNSKDLISFDSEKWVGVSKLKNIVERSFSQYGVSAISTNISNTSDLKNSSIWFKQGENCEILRAGSSGWQTGKIKINVTLEFIPEEPESIESPLDDIRQAEINNIE